MIDPRTGIPARALFFVLFTGAALFACAGCGDDDPVGPTATPGAPSWSMVRPPCDNLRDVWGRALDDVYAVGHPGLVLHFDGQDWNSQDTPPVGKIELIQGTSDGAIYAGGGSGSLLVHEGGAWRAVELSPDHHVRSLWCGAGGQAFCGMTGGRVARRIGAAWTLEVLDTDEQIFGIWSDGAGGVWAMDRLGGFFRSTSPGLWERLESPGSSITLDLWGATAEGLYTRSVGYGGLMRFDGTEWHEDLAGVSVGEMIIVSATEAFAFTSNNDVFHLLDGQWNLRSTTGSQVGGAWMAPTGEIFAAGYGPTLLRGGPDAWQAMEHGILPSLLAVWGDGPRAVAVGAEGTIVELDGPTAIVMTPVVSGTLNDVWGSDASGWFAVGRETILHGRAGVWTPMPGAEDALLLSVWGFSGSDVYAGGMKRPPMGAAAGEARIPPADVWECEEPILLHYDGTAWQEIETDLECPFDDIWGRAGDDLYLAGAGGLHHFDGVTATEIPLIGGGEEGTPWLTKISGADDDGVICTGVYLQLPMTSYIWRLDGGTWQVDATLVESPLYVGVFGVAGGAEYATDSGGGLWTRTEGVWLAADDPERRMVYDLWGDATEGLYAVGRAGGIWRFAR